MMLRRRFLGLAFGTGLALVLGDRLAGLDLVLPEPKVSFDSLLESIKEVYPTRLVREMEMRKRPFTEALRRLPC